MHLTKTFTLVVIFVSLPCLNPNPAAASALLSGTLRLTLSDPAASRQGHLPLGCHSTCEKVRKLGGEVISSAGLLGLVMARVA